MKRISIFLLSLTMLLLMTGCIETYDDGYVDGHDDGYGEGYDDGYDEGYWGGHDDGYDEGYDEGNYDGYDDGYDDGYWDGYWEGYYDNDELIFWQENAVLVTMTGSKYHTYDCYHIEGRSYYIYNIELAQYKGYKPCLDCIGY